ncbi:hypothetical protein ABFV74_20080 [Pseudoalteromonas distincta]|uniref:hypothetical protein n=1 Tax=Pseudoalteromonas distincta TaxID=77608 RepID=UPI003218C039
MSKSASYSNLFSILNENKVSVSSDLITIQSDKNFDANNLEKHLNSIGYIFDNHRTIRANKIELSLEAANWDAKCPFFETWQKVFDEVDTSSILPNFYYVIEDKTSNFDEHINAKKLQVFCKVRELLAQLSDHCEPSSGAAKGSRKLVYIVELENSISKHEFKPFILWSKLSKADYIVSSLPLVEKLLMAINVGDSQDIERKNVLRSAFSELISGCVDQNEIFSTIIRSLAELDKKYDAHHELFVKRFSVNKVLLEINEQDLKYTSKINEIVSSAQNKALTIPGALIAIGAIMKIDHIADAIAVGVGLLVTTIIIHRSLGVHEATITHINKQVNSDFKRYDTLNEKAEIRAQAVSTAKDLNLLLRKASKNSSFIKKCIWLILLSSLLFLIFSSFPASPSELI